MRQKFDCFLCRNLMAFRAWTLEFWSWDPRLPDQASPGPWTSPFVSFFSSPTSSPNLQSVVQHLLVVVQNHELLSSTSVLVPIRLIISITLFLPSTYLVMLSSTYLVLLPSTYLMMLSFTFLYLPWNFFIICHLRPQVSSSWINGEHKQNAAQLL